MTKMEAARVASLEDALARARAMRWPDYNMPAPMTRSDIDANLTEGGTKYGNPQRVARGWFANSHRSTSNVTYGCSNGVHHADEGDVTTTQHMGRMYATEADAWRAVRYEMTERFSAELARIDAKIADAGSRP